MRLRNVVNDSADVVFREVIPFREIILASLCLPYSFTDSSFGVINSLVTPVILCVSAGSINLWELRGHFVESFILQNLYVQTYVLCR